MPPPTNRVRGDGRSLLWPTAGFALLFGGSYWVVDALLDALVFGSATLAEAFWAPGAEEVFDRLVLPAVVGVLAGLRFYRRREFRRQLLLSRVLEKAPDGILVSGLDGSIVYCSQSIETLSGHPRVELEGKVPELLCADRSLIRRQILPAIHAHGRWAGLVVAQHRDGQRFPVWVVASSVRESDDGPPMIIAIIRDITGPRKAQQALRDYATELEHSNQLKELFADIMRHDLANPATAVKVTADVMLKTELDEKRRRQLSIIREASDRLIEMTESAARYSRLTSLEQLDFEALDLRVSWEAVSRDLEQEAQKRQQRVVLIGTGARLAQANPMVREVFFNLLSNAIKYGPLDSAVEVEIEDCGNSWLSSVRDRGEGVSEPDRERIFTRFERLGRSAVKGTGLGLAIAKRIVDLHHGRIWVEENPGGGAIFRVSLPKEQPALPAEREAARHPGDRARA